MTLTNSNNYDILLDSERIADFLLPKNRVQSRLEKSNRFSLTAEMHPFLLEEKMPRGIYDRTKSKPRPHHKGICLNTGRTHFQKNTYQGFGFKKNHIPWNKGKPSWNRGKKMPETSGKNNWNWKGGITSFRTIIRRLPEMKKWTQEVFRRDNYTCRECGVKNGLGKAIYFNAHHIRVFSIIMTEFLQEYSQFSPFDDKETLLRLAITYQPFWDINNGKTLCKDCHKIINKQQMLKNKYANRPI